MLFRLVVETDEGQQRQITISIVMAVEESELLLAVRGIFSRIEIDGHTLGLAMPAPLMTIDDGLGQRRTQAIVLSWADAVLETREGGLRRKLWATERLTIQQQLEDRIVGQARGIVSICIAARQTIDALP